MTLPEQRSNPSATFTMPAVLSTWQKGQDWLYSAIRFVVTDTADKWIVRHVLDTRRS
jgi:hypothetical protein